MMIKRIFAGILAVMLLLTAIGCALLYFFQDPLIRLYLQGDGSPADAAAWQFCLRGDW